MKEVEMLKHLAADAKIQINVLAELCHCSPTAIANYIHDVNLPTGSKQLAIQEGLRKYKEMINRIIQE